MNPLRVLIPMLYYYPDRPSGSVRLAFDEAVYLAAQGHEVWVITQDPTGKQPEYARRDGLHVLHYPSPQVGLFSPRRMTIHQQLTRALLQKYVPQGVDLIHGHSLLHTDGAFTLYPRARRAYSVHSPVKMEMQASSRGESTVRRLYYAITGELTHRIERRILQQCHVITSDSAYTRAMLAELHSPEIAARVQVVPGWVDTERFQIAEDRAALKARFGWRLDAPLMFTLRRLVPRNGIDRLVAALALVKQAGYTFEMVIGGLGPLQAQLEAQAHDLGLGDSVRFIGFVSDDDLPLMYAAADVFILPTSELECFGLITLEAFAAGRPVLATPVAAIPEVMRPMEAAWLAADATPDKIAALIIAYLQGALPSHDPAALRQYAVEGYARERVIPQLVKAVLAADSLAAALPEEKPT
ncbi:MAG: hypothetical protein OHK0046_09560 [Anaerolineae bacterium]